mgnify:CR=1 FL=1
MRIAILTLPLHTNYGGILQCYALQTVLQRMGHKVRVLVKPQYGHSYYIIYPLAICKRIIKRYIFGKKVDIWLAPHEIAGQHIDRFIKRYIRQYKCRNWNSELVQRLDAIVVGSDQVWRPAYSQPIEQAFLSFLEDTQIKRVAYAASFGVDICEYTKEQLEICSFLLKKFDAVSVREASGVNLCRRYFGVEALQMLDPTLLLSADDYRALIRKAHTEPSKGNMLVYILDKTPEKEFWVEKIARDKGLIPFWLDSSNERTDNLPLEKQIKMPVEQWLKSFDDAEFVFTDSFHGCIFSIIFRRQFLAFGNQERGLSRFHSLLDLFSLNERLIISSDDYLPNYSVIDFDEVYKKLDQLKIRANEFLTTILKE